MAPSPCLKEANSPQKVSLLILNINVQSNINVNLIVHIKSTF